MSNKDINNHNGGEQPAPKALSIPFNRRGRFKYIMRYVIFGLVALLLVAAGVYFILDFDEPVSKQPKSSAVAAEDKNPLYAVDMGLSVAWASINIGAESPSDGGDFFAWGDVAPRETFGWRDAVSYNKGYPSVLDATSDAAAVLLGDGWRMPTREEFQELIDKCRWHECERDGVYGFEVVAPNENTIFLPAAGYRYDTQCYHAGIEAIYWSASSADCNDKKQASAMRISNHERVVDDYYRYYGAHIRAVKNI